METETEVPVSNEEEVCSIIGKAVMDLSMTGQPVNRATLSLKLLSMADNDRDDERVLLYWIARRALSQPRSLSHARC